MELSSVFLLAGSIILVGFLGGIAFERTRIPDVIMLLGVGILMGPVLNISDPRDLARFAEQIGTFALMVILFEGGMDLDLRRLLKEFPTASLLVVFCFCLSVFGITALLHLIFGWGLFNSLLLGSILGCTSAAIVIPVIRMLPISDEVKTVLCLESALSDVFAIVLTVALINFFQLEHIGIQAPLHAVASSFSIALVIGIAAAILWLKILSLFTERKYSYMATLAAMMITFGLVEFLGGSGPIAVLLFGTVLGNSREFEKLLRLRCCVLMDETIRFLHGEVTFFIRTFFFVYMGMILSIRSFDPDFLMTSGALVFVILVVRFLSVKTVINVYKDKRGDQTAMLSMLPRGLASAVLATLPASANIGGTELFVDYTFAIIVLTNIFMTTGILLGVQRSL